MSLPVLGRLATVAVAVIAAVGVVDCARFTSSGYDSADDGNVSYGASGVVSPRTRVTLGEILSSAGGTYIGRLLADRDSTLERWSNRTLRVWIDTSVVISGVQAGFPAAVRAAFDQWLSTGIPLHVEYVRSPRDANIRVRWTEHLPHKTGSTTWRTNRSGYLTSGDITLATHVSDGHPLDERGMRAIALHEVGHALGMSHSLDERDVMAALVRVDSLSDVDRGTIKLLYALPAGPVH